MTSAHQETGAAWWRPVQAQAVAAGHVADTYSSTSRVAFRALVAFTAILLLSPQIWFPILGTLRIAFLAAGLAIAAHLVQRLARPEPAPFFPEIVIAATLVIWAIITIPVSYWPGGSVEVLSDRYIKAVAFFWLIGTVVTTTARLRVMAWAFVLCSIPLAITGIHHYLTGMFLRTAVPGLHRIYGYEGGIGQDILAMNESRGDDWVSVHNAFLEYAVDLGLPGLVLFVWLYLTCLLSAFGIERRAAKHPAAGDLAALAGGVKISLLAFCVAAFFHPIAYQ